MRRWTWFGAVVVLRTCNLADDATRYVFEDEIARLEFDKVAEKITAEHMGIEPMADNRNQIDFRRSLLKKQADQLRAAIPNPFQ